MSTKLPNPNKLPQSEWFSPVRADDVPSDGKVLHIKASAAQQKEIAKRLDVRRIDPLEADILVSSQNGGHTLHISGTVKATVIQDCVVSNDPIESVIEEPFEAWYANHEKAASFARAQHKLKAIEEGDEVQMLEECDDPEPLIDGQVDVGEVAIQFLSLAINPYPRKDGGQEDSDAEENATADAVPVTAASGSASLRPNPFAALKNWRPKD